MQRNVGVAWSKIQMVGVNSSNQWKQKRKNCHGTITLNFQRLSVTRRYNSSAPCLFVATYVNANMLRKFYLQHIHKFNFLIVHYILFTLYIFSRCQLYFMMRLVLSSSTAHSTYYDNVPKFFCIKSLQSTSAYNWWFSPLFCRCITVWVDGVCSKVRLSHMATLVSSLIHCLRHCLSQCVQYQRTLKVIADHVLSFFSVVFCYFIYCKAVHWDYIILHNTWQCIIQYNLYCIHAAHVYCCHYS